MEAELLEAFLVWIDSTYGVTPRTYDGEQAWVHESEEENRRRLIREFLAERQCARR